MNKVKIEVCSLGILPRDFDKKSLQRAKSNIFEVTSALHSYDLRVDSDLEMWAYSDGLLASQTPKKEDVDILVILTAVPLQENYYTRRLDNNVVIFTFFEISRYLKFEDIPLENVVKRLLYSYSLVYLRNQNRIPTSDQITNFTHDDTRGCIFDMNGVKEDIVYSCHLPIICDECCERMRKERVSSETLTIAKSELRKITKERFYVIADWIKRYPILSILISSAWALLLGVLGSIIVGLFYGE
ncbi:hypothetical protein [Kangiella shandongensis]|uniref:hypothetical protein n=1 Tax=Kangiella shandongensis TaxID=2763258 RepID=UPI001CBF18DA|nr:hypothetical protein [Kangiella shandongensis]